MFDHDLHFDVAAGADFGHIAAGNMVGFGGLHAELGLRRDRFSLLAEFELAETQSPTDDSQYGMYERIAFEARASIWQGIVRGSRTELWIEPGIGYETATQMNNMAPIERRDYSFALGVARTHIFGSRTFGAYAELNHGLSLLMMSGLLVGR